MTPQDTRKHRRANDTAHRQQKRAPNPSLKNGEGNKFTPESERVLRIWPQDLDMTTPLELGLKRDEKVEDLMKEYINSLKPQ
ncbi:hypothetical protein Daesc_004608 [Daldinia eschscholtzii]|uniref:Uncharacterized protein n=1 Tax=Daldinia eschscholtzii TaxID=292717 RepID=A0AAX6MR39_9PEZI